MVNKNTKRARVKVNRDSTGLRLLREQAGLSREALAREADVSSSTINLVEGGWTCSGTTAEKIASALGCQPADLWPTIPAARPEHVQRLDLSPGPDGFALGRIRVGDVIVTLRTRTGEKDDVAILRVEPVEEAA